MGCACPRKYHLAGSVLENVICSVAHPARAEFPAVGDSQDHCVHAPLLSLHHDRWTYMARPQRPRVNVLTLLFVADGFHAGQDRFTLVDGMGVLGLQGKVHGDLDHVDGMNLGLGAPRHLARPAKGMFTYLISAHRHQDSFEFVLRRCILAHGFVVNSVPGSSSADYKCGFSANQQGWVTGNPGKHNIDTVRPANVGVSSKGSLV